jgi:hypothetical protein
VQTGKEGTAAGRGEKDRVVGPGCDQRTAACRPAEALRNFRDKSVEAKALDNKSTTSAVNHQTSTTLRPARLTRWLSS